MWKKVVQYVDLRHAEKDHAKLSDMFLEFDQTGDGSLTYDELFEALNAVGLGRIFFALFLRFIVLYL